MIANCPAKKAGQFFICGFLQVGEVLNEKGFLKASWSWRFENFTPLRFSKKWRGLQSSVLKKPVKFALDIDQLITSSNLPQATQERGKISRF